MIYKKRPRKSILDRMLAKTIIPYTIDGDKDITQCWIWNGGTNNAGYGMMRVRGEVNMILSHRVSYIETYQNMRYNDKHEVLHSCGNKLCVNPHHLTKGNVKDRHALQRQYNRYNYITFNDKEKMYVTCEHCGKTEYLPHFERLHRLCNVLAKHKYITHKLYGKRK
jgi:hypothetical protein